TNWNGVIGAIQLQARGSMVIDDVQVYPDIEKKQALVRGTILNKSDTATKAKITLDAKTIHGQEHDPDGIEESITLSPGENHFEMTYDMGQACLLWDEFSPNVYQMKATVLADDSKDEKTVSFGMRQFKAGGTQFVINGRKLFLRGTLECCIFPLTGYPPTDINEWARIIKVAQSHGLNHFRFHSWCPPRAAFEAADKLGFYFQVEGPVWGTVGDGDPVDDYIYTECERILKEYGNHPSFVMMAYGNEPWGDNHEAYLNKLVKHLKAIDARHLYTAASGWAHVPQNQYHSDYKPRVQLWNANLTSRINALPPETVTDYRDFVAKSKVPIVSHEIGQWCAYPNYNGHRVLAGSSCWICTTFRARERHWWACSTRSGIQSPMSAPISTADFAARPCRWPGWENGSGPTMKPSPPTSRSPTLARNRSRTPQSAGRSLRVRRFMLQET
ncbi:MAG: glycoside hydrolase family 2 TIM barrel-domain containing protein, partial [Planctomycetota bacterium]